MVAPCIVSREQVQAEPYIVWNEYVGVLAMSDYDALTAIQRVAHLCFWYDSELQNGGHLQYFENHGDNRVAEVIRSLQTLGAIQQAEVLSRAAHELQQKRHAPIETAADYVEAALAGQFAHLDRDYNDCRPTITELLDDYLKRHCNDFVVIVE